MIFYCGADRKVDKPIYKHSDSNPNNDYGLGFLFNASFENINYYQY